MPLGGFRRRGEPAVGLHPLLEGRLDRAVVRHVVGHAMGFDGSRAAAQSDIHPLGRQTLDRRQLLHVRADLEERGRSDVTGELGVHDLVTPGAEAARPHVPDQEVRQPEPPSIEERGLVDHVVATLDGLACHPCRGLQARPAIGLSAVLGDSSHSPPLRLQSREVAPLVLLSALRDQIQLRVQPIRLRHEPGQRGQFQPDEMLAGQEADQIRGREDGPAIDELHRHHHTAGR